MLKAERVDFEIRPLPLLKGDLVLPSLVDGLAHAQRSEEQNAWRHPIDLIELLTPHLDRLARLAPGQTALDGEFDALVSAVLDDDPGAGLEAISAALERGVAFAEVGQAVFMICAAFMDASARLSSATRC